MSTDAGSEVGGQLDDHHAPETNGRMSVCRKCGSQTDSTAGGRHTPDERQAGRLADWLTGQARLTHIARLREARGEAPRSYP